jgi:cytochrome c biogenesis protein CcmG/thiol:disulfide interchange protein DsbE
MKKQFLKLPIIIFFIILFIFFYLLIIDRNPSKVPSALLNKSVPNFESETLIKNKKFVSSKEFGNQVVIVNFFATWCKPCKDEHVFIKRFADDQNIKVIGINYKDDSRKTIKWLQKLGNPYSSVAIDKNGKIAIDWGVYGIPETFVISSKGEIKYRHVGAVTSKIYKKINQLIKEIE